jgi:transcriptional regulator NrdR family protein
MFCVNCFCEDTKVINSRPHKRHPSVWRRRQCPRCGHLFTTDEHPRIHELYEVWNSKTNSSSPFNMGGLILSIAEAFQHNKQLGAQVAWDIAFSVLDIVATDYRRALSSDDIAMITHRCLERYDKAAALSYGLQHRLVTGERRPGRPTTFGASSVDVPAPAKQVSPYQSHRTYRDTYRAQDESGH